MINEVIIFVNVIIKSHYNNKYTPLNFKKENKIYLYFYYNYKILK